jgi:response regulator RpfG family c-di-GMP phosphodiesterase
MASLRPHQKTRALEDILMEMEQYKGKQFDPKILEIFLREKIYGHSARSPSSFSFP